MSNIALYSDMDNGNTSVSNLFIDEYLCEANDAQIKVYLYLLRMTQAARTTSISDMADRFNHTEKDICRALKYWETKGLMALAYDAMGTIIGIQVFSARPMSGMPFSPMAGMQTGPMYATIPLASYEPSYVTNMPSPAPAVLEPKAPEIDSRFIKPVYSADELRAFKNNEETSALMFLAETYLKRTLKPADIQSLLFITDKLEFSLDMVDYLLQYCVGKEKTKFSYIESVAIAWAEKGITTPEAAQKESSDYDKNIYKVMRALGKTSSPTEVEVDFIKKWRNDFGFSTDVILEACERTVLSTDKGRFKYANKILECWSKAGVRNKKDIEKADAAFKNVTAIGNAKPKTGNNSFQKYEKNNEYDFNSLENLLLKQQ